MKITVHTLFTILLFFIVSCSPPKPTAAELNEGGEPDFRISCGLIERNGFYGFNIYAYFFPVDDKPLPLDQFAGNRDGMDYTHSFDTFLSLDSLLDQVYCPEFLIENHKGEFSLLLSPSSELGCFRPSTPQCEVFQILTPRDTCFTKIPFNYGWVQVLEPMLENNPTTKYGQVVRLHYAWRGIREDYSEVHHITSNWLDLREYFRIEFGN